MITRVVWRSRCAHESLRLGAKHVHGCLQSTLSDRSAFDQLAKSNSAVVLDCSRSDHVAILAMNYQAKKNALSKEFVHEFSNAISQLEKDHLSKVAIICSLVPKVFCAGADLKERAEYADDEVPAVVGSLRSLFHRIYLLPMPTIAALDGAALGGGLELALACDIRYASDLPGTRLGLVETHWALLPGAGGTQRLPRLIGEAKAKELMFAARILNARQAAEVGMVNEAIDPTSVTPAWQDRPSVYRAMQYAQELCTKGPIAIRQLKRAVIQGLNTGSVEAGLSVEAECYKVLIPTVDRKEGMKAFKERRQPIYHGH